VSEHELDPVECQMLGMSIDKAQRMQVDLKEFKRKDASGGVDTPAPSSQVPDFVLKRTSIIVPIEELK